MILRYELISLPCKYDSNIQQCLQTLVLGLSLLILFLSMKTSKITIRIPMFVSTKHRFFPQIQASNEVKENFKNFQRKSFSVLHLNIRSMNKNFESFSEFLDLLGFSFNAVCLSGKQCQPHETSNSNLQMPGYVSLHQPSKNRRGEGFAFSYLNPSPTKSEMTQL